MCIGIPMKIVSCDGLVAVCRNDEEGRDEVVDLSLIGSQKRAIGCWSLWGRREKSLTLVSWKWYCKREKRWLPH